MRDILAAWGQADLPCTHHAARENHVYRVGAPPQFALRQHRRGLRSLEQIEAELTWMGHLADQGLAVPRPQALTTGGLVLDVDGQLYSLITWLPGVQLGQGQRPLTLTRRTETFFQLGALLAKLHQLSGPEGLDRPLWDSEGLLGDQPLWGTFWDHPHLTPQQRQAFLTFRAQAQSELAARALPLQLIHADPLQENVLVQDQGLALIDFDDCAYGFTSFDLVTPLVQRLPNPDYEELRAALLNGYGQSVDPPLLDLMLAIRCLTYVGWVKDKMADAAGQAMSGRIVRRAVSQVEAYLART